MVAVAINLISIDERGVAYISETRIKVSLIVRETKQGYTPQQIQEAHDHLSLGQIHAALAYYYCNEQAIDGEIDLEDDYANRMLPLMRPVNAGELRERLGDRKEKRGR